MNVDEGERVVAIEAFAEADDGNGNGNGNGSTPPPSETPPGDVN
jgi:hypothetical protein